MLFRSRPLASVPAAIAHLPVSLEDGGKTLCYRGGDGSGTGRSEVADVTKALTAAGIDYVGIDVRESSLEDIFVDLLEKGEAA